MQSHSNSPTPTANLNQIVGGEHNRNVSVRVAGPETFENLLDRDSVVVGVSLKPTYFLERRAERARHIPVTSRAVTFTDARHEPHAPHADHTFHYSDLWRDCWCLKPGSVRDLWERYLSLRRFSLPKAIFERKYAYWRREEEHEGALRERVAKRFKFEPAAHALIEQADRPPSASSEGPDTARVNEAYIEAVHAENAVRQECAKVLALHVALDTTHDALHGKRSYGDVNLLFPLTRLERRLNAYARNEVTRNVLNHDDSNGDHMFDT